MISVDTKLSSVIGKKPLTDEGVKYVSIMYQSPKTRKMKNCYRCCMRKFQCVGLLKSQNGVAM